MSTAITAVAIKSVRNEKRFIDKGGLGHQSANDPSSATRPTRAFDCNSSAMAGFAAAHG